MTPDYRATLRRLEKEAAFIGPIKRSSFVGGPSVPGPAPKGSWVPPALTVGDWWRYGIRLRAKCECGADRELPPGSAIKLFGENHQFKDETDIPRVARAVVCGTCGRKGRATVTVVKG